MISIGRKLVAEKNFISESDLILSLAYWIKFTPDESYIKKEPIKSNSRHLFIYFIAIPDHFQKFTTDVLIE